MTIALPIRVYYHQYFAMTYDMPSTSAAEDASRSSFAHTGGRTSTMRALRLRGAFSDPGFHRQPGPDSWLSIYPSLSWHLIISYHPAQKPPDPSKLS